MGIFIDHKIIACASVFWPWFCFARFFAAFTAGNRLLLKPLHFLLAEY